MLTWIEFEKREYAEYLLEEIRKGAHSDKLQATWSSPSHNKALYLDFSDLPLIERYFEELIQNLPFVKDSAIISRVTVTQLIVGPRKAHHPVDLRRGRVLTYVRRKRIPRKEAS